MRYTAQVQIRSYEVGADGLLHHAHVARFVLHAGNLVTQALGIGADWYEAQGTFFVVRGLKLEFESGAREDETLNLTTWLSSSKRFRGHREVALASAADGRQIANAQLDWVYIDRATLAPVRMQAEISDRLQIEPHHACRHAVHAGAPLGMAVIHTRAVQHHELDQLRHVNSAAYVEWCEQAWCEATGGVPGAICGHHLEYLKQTLLGDPVQIVTQPRDNHTWTQEVRHSATGDVHVRNLISTRV